VKLQAWYSQKMAKINGTFRYRKEDGEVIIGTIATRTMDHGCLWDDMVPLGEVVECLGRETNGEITELDYSDQNSIKKIFEIIDREDQHRWN